NPKVCHDVPSSKQSGTTPMPIKLDRWMRSNDWVITARMPSRVEPLAAQSREEPVPYSLLANTTSGTRSDLYRIAASYIVIFCFDGWWIVTPHPTPGTIRFLM